MEGTLPNFCCQPPMLFYADREHKPSDHRFQFSDTFLLCSLQMVCTVPNSYFHATRWCRRDTRHMISSYPLRFLVCVFFTPCCLNTLRLIRVSCQRCMVIRTRNTFHGIRRQNSLVGVHLHSRQMQFIPPLRRCLLARSFCTGTRCTPPCYFLLYLRTCLQCSRG